MFIIVPIYEWVGSGLGLGKKVFILKLRGAIELFFFNLFYETVFVKAPGCLLLFTCGF